MSADPFLTDAIHLTGRYYARLRELLGTVEPASLSAKVGEQGLSVGDTIRHLCETELWYLNRIDRGTRELGEVADTAGALADALDRAEAAMTGFLTTVDPEVLTATSELTAWWAEGEPRSARLILMHSLAHKYYHCGQLQSILHALNA